MHKRETAKPTNTGRLAALVMPDSHTLVRGHAPGEAPPVDYGVALEPGRQAYLLYPADGAPPLSADEIAADGRPVTLVVPDGSWRQASKVATRVPELAAVPRRGLPEGPESRYRLRRESKDGGLATCEAIARAAGVIEGAKTQARIERAFDAFVAATLASRGAG